MLTAYDQIKTDKKCAACGGYEHEKPVGVYMFDAEPPIIRFALCEKHAKLLTEGSPAAKQYVQDMAKADWCASHSDEDGYVNAHDYLDRSWWEMLPEERETWASKHE